MKNYKVALVHDYLQEFGGAERVLLALHRAFPQAPLFTAFYDPRGLGNAASLFQDLDIRTTYIQKIPLHTRLRSPLRMVAPDAFRRLDLSDFDVVISSSNAYHAKSVTTHPPAVHLTYCHTPARSLYGYDTRSDWRHHALTHTFGEIANHFLRLEDFAAAQKVDAVLVNSHVVEARVAKYWRRSAHVVYPPVAFADLVRPEDAAMPLQERPYYLFVNRLNYAKHPELAVQAAIDLHLPLKIVGTGPMQAALVDQIQRAGAEEHVELLGGVTDEKLQDLYRHARALLYPVVDEDFGIVPVEAMAYGVPVIAHRSGGPQETIIDGKTGVFLDILTLEALKAAIESSQKTVFDPLAIQTHAKQFGEARFIAQVQNLVDEYVKKT